MKKNKYTSVFSSRFNKVGEKSKSIFSASDSSIKDSNENKKVVKNKTLLSRSWKSFSSISFTRMSIKDQTFFVKRLSFLIKAGIPMLESLIMIREQTRRKGYGSILDSVIADVSRGQYLSTGLGKFRHMFGDFSINIISFGESSGILSENLEYLAEELKKKEALRKKIISAFIYPAIVTMATFAITGFLMIYLFPKIMPVFSSLRITLPLSTRIVIHLSNFLQNNWLLLISTISIIIIGTVIAVKKSKTFAFAFDKSILKMPLIGNIIQSYNLANTTRTLGLLLKSGTTVSEALPIAAKVSGNLVYRKELEKLSEVIGRGEKMSVYLMKKRHLFPDVLTQIVSVGERSGNLSHSLIYLSELYEAEVDDFTKNLSGLIEPIMMIVMGLMVGFIAISIITPIYSITQNLS
jgi:type IV pilus assembly protein PilC